MTDTAKLDDNLRLQRITFEETSLNSAQHRAWTETRAALLWHCPAFSHILYSMMNGKCAENIAVFTPGVPIAATDGATLFLNPETFFNYTLNERVFIVAHEIMHCIYNHCALGHAWRMRGKIGYPDGSSLPYNHEIMNVAMDLVINDALIESNVGVYNQNWLHDKSIANYMDSVLDAYRKIFDKSKDGKSGGGVSGFSFDQHLSPGTGEGKDPQSASSERNEVEWKTAVAAAMAAAKAQGKLPSAIERIFKDALEPKVSWGEKIEAFFARKVGSGGYDWRRPDRRLIARDDAIYAPGRSGHGAGTVVVGVDTSGSIGERELDMFFAEMSGILEDVRPKRLLVVWCDAKVHRVDELEDASDLSWVRAKGAPGGGGTAFEPVFDWIDKNGVEPDALVYLTDGMGSFPQHPPSYPTLWGNIYPNSQYPFGEVVDVPKSN